MIIDWSVVITVEHEFDQSTDRAKGIATVEMKVQRIVEGDDETCDALWAAEYAKEHLREMLKLPRAVMLRVLEINIKQAE